MARESCRLAADTHWIIGDMDGLCLSDASLSDTENSTVDADAEPPRDHICYALASNAYLDRIYVSHCDDDPLGSLGRCPVTCCFCYYCCQNNLPPVSGETSVSVSSTTSSSQKMSEPRVRRRMRGVNLKRGKCKEGSTAIDSGKQYGTGVYCDAHVFSSSVVVKKDKLNSGVGMWGGGRFPSEANLSTADQCSRETDTASMANDSSTSFSVSSGSSSISPRWDLVPGTSSSGYMGGGCSGIDDSSMLSSSEYDSEGELGGVDVATSRLRFPEGLQGIACTASLREEEEPDTQTQNRHVLTLQKQRRVVGGVWHSNWMWNAVLSVFLTTAGAFLTGGGIKLRVGRRLPTVYQREEVPILQMPAEGEPRYRIKYKAALNGHLVMEKVALDSARTSEGGRRGEGRMEVDDRHYLTDCDEMGSLKVQEAGFVGEEDCDKEVGTWEG